MSFRYPYSLDRDDWYEPEPEAPQYATSLTGFVDSCEICGQDIDDHTGLCRTHTRWADAEPYGHYDRPRDFQREPWAS